jgi:histone demethylase JARID1
VEASQYGLCKIVPPAKWRPTPHILMSHPLDFPTRTQNINRLQEGRGFEDGKRYNIRDYKKMADSFRDSWSRQYIGGQEMTRDQICKEYWDAVETGVRPAVVEYGNDLDTSVFGSGFITDSNISIMLDSGHHNGSSNSHSSSNDTETSAAESKDDSESDEFDTPYYLQSGWNLTKLPTVSGSLLQHITESINGVNVPWLYIGMMFASFCWHTEDNYLYSINYSHFGDIKQWYGIPSKHAKAFEKVCEIIRTDACMM